MKHLTLAGCLVFLFTFSSCSSRHTPSALTDKEFAHVYAALTQKSVSVRGVRIDTAQARHTADSILQANHVSRSEVLATVEQLNHDPSRWKVVMEEVLQDMRDSVGR